MAAFRALLVAMLVVLAAYTAVVISNHGWDLLSVFFGDMATMAWPGQFNLDFLFMLTLSAIWVRGVTSSRRPGLLWAFWRSSAARCF